jgi:hypothetical protein
MVIFFQHNHVCLIKIQIESNLRKLTHKVHHAQRSYFFSTCRWHRSPVMPSPHSSRAPDATVDANGQFISRAAKIGQIGSGISLG